MKRSCILGVATVLAAIVLVWSGDAFGRGGLGGVGGGGGRAGGGGARMGGGGMSRPSGGMSRPSGGMSRPGGGMAHSPSRPSMGNVSRPSGGASRPSLPTRPGGGNIAGGFSPSGGRPSTRPSVPNRFPTASTGQRPSISQPGDLRPATRPSLPGAGGGIQRPTLPSRPDIGRPDIGGITRPGAGGGGIERPSLPDRPSIGDITRPGQGGGGIQRPLPERPIGPDRPNRPDRPTIGGGGNNINRPGGDNIHIGDNNLINRPGNINIGNNVNINRPGWGLTRPGSDWWSQNHNWNNWHDGWHDHCIHDHYHGWYNGCWGGNWGYGAYVPFVYGAAAWGGWGYGQSYYNPYYVESTAPAYDYSQPVVVNNYVTSDANAAGGTAAAPPPESPENQQAMKLFDDGMAAFKAGNYPQALAKYEGALKLMPTDPVLHEVRALTLFALGKYQEAAATLNSLLASSPGMDWTSMSALYGNADDYTQQLRKLEAHIKANPKDAPAIFVLAYHYLVIGQNDEAIKALQEVVRLQPKDATAQRMLASLAPPETKPAETTPPAAAPADAPSTDLVGTWRASSGDTVIELTIDDKYQFTWKATPKGKPAVEVKGTVSTSDDTLVMESKEQGNMAGQVKSGGPDKFTFAMQGGPPGEPALAFARAS